MRWARFRRLNWFFTIVLLLLVAAWAFGPQLGLVVPLAAVFVVGLVLFGLNIALVFRTLRLIRADAARVVAAHPGEVAFPSQLISWLGGARTERDSVVAITADRRGLSFRDQDDREVLLVEPERIMSLELAPLEPRRVRPFRVTTIDGVIDFSGPAKPDEQVDAIVALRTAIGRPAG
ncbi:MAG: hypothetical protein ABIQ01_10195 [Pseudolysinimonas sp.]